MIEPRDLASKTHNLRRAFDAKLGVKSRSLSQALKRAGRRLPRRLHKQGAVLVRAEHLVNNPKLARQITPSEVDQAYDAISGYLGSIDVADRRKAWMLSMAGAVAANVLIVAALFIWWLWAQGYVGV